MKGSIVTVSLAVLALIVTLSIASAPNAFAGQDRVLPEPQRVPDQAQLRPELLQIIKDKDAYVAGIVQRWKTEAEASGRWDASEANLTGQLMKLRAETLLLASQASSFKELMEIAMLGQPLDTMMKSSPFRWQEGQIPPIVQAVIPDQSPSVFGDTTQDLVYTPITPCRIVDTRNIGGPLSAYPTVYGIDVDNPTSNAFQGGYAGYCGVPNGVAWAVAVTLTVVSPSGPGWFSAWSLGHSWPGTAMMTYSAGQIISTNAIVPVWPGSGADMDVTTYAPTHVVIDISGYFAPPNATPLDCNYQFIQGTGTGNVANHTGYAPGAASCSAGYTNLSTYCGYAPGNAQGLSLEQNGPGVVVGGIGWTACIWRNDSGGAFNGSDFFTITRCCRIPGR